MATLAAAAAAVPQASRAQRSEQMEEEKETESRRPRSRGRRGGGGWLSRGSHGGSRAQGKPGHRGPEFRIPSPEAKMTEERREVTVESSAGRDAAYGGSR